jgi:hypothetical protein
MTLKPARPSLVIFDMDEVLCHYDLGRRLRFLANIADTTARNVRASRMRGPILTPMNISRNFPNAWALI